MKKKFFKTAFATACVVVAGMGCFKAYNASNQSKESMLLAENVEALSVPDGDTGSGASECEFGDPIYGRIGAFYGKTNKRIHYEGGGNVDQVFKDITYTQCYAFDAGRGEVRGTNEAVINIDFGTYSIEPCEGPRYHYDPFPLK